VRPVTVPTVPKSRALQRLTAWEASPVLPQRPAPVARRADGTLVAWRSVLAGVEPPSAGANGFILLTTTLKPSRSIVRNGGTLSFSAVTGRGAIWIDGRQVSLKTDAATAPWRVPIGPGDAARDIAVILDAVAGERTGFPGAIVIEPKEAAANG